MTLSVQPCHLLGVPRVCALQDRKRPLGLSAPVPSVPRGLHGRNGRSIRLLGPAATCAGPARHVLQHRNSHRNPLFTKSRLLAASEPDPLGLYVWCAPASLEAFAPGMRHSGTEEADRPGELRFLIPGRIQIRGHHGLQDCRDRLDCSSRADGQRNRSHRSRPWLFLLPSVASQARCARTHCGRRRPGKEPRTAYALVSAVWLVRRRAVCKTVGSAYVGSNPTPATTCENGPLARNSRLCGPFVLCPVVCHLVALRDGVSRCPRTYGGRDSCPITVGAHRRLFHGRPRTGRVGGVLRLDVRR